MLKMAIKLQFMNRYFCLCARSAKAHLHTYCVPVMCLMCCMC